MRPLLAALIATVALAACDSGGDEHAAGRQGAAAKQIDAPLVMRHLRALQRAADGNGGNRAAGTSGYRESARYVASVLRDAGWTVRLERFRFPWWSERSSVMRLAPGGAPAPRPRLPAGHLLGRGTGRRTAAPRGQRVHGGRARRHPPGDVALARPDGCLFRVKAANAAPRGRRGAPHRGPLSQ